MLFLLVSENTFTQELISTQKRLSDEQIQNVIRESKQEIQSILGKEIYLPGMAITLVSRDEILWADGFGYSDKLRKEKVDSNTMFGILSVSKTITVTGLMMAVQEGLVDLDVPIKTYLPSFHVQTRYSEDPMSAITMRHLLSMTSGLTHDAPVGNNADPSGASYEDHIRSICQTWLRFRTGERAEYSNLGIELAAHILETIIRKPFTEYISAKVFNPLGMTRSTYDLQRIRKDENRATGNNRNFESVPLENPMLAPGGIYSSITDMARFMQFHLNCGKVEGTAIITEQILKQMHTIPFAMKEQITGYGQGLWIRYYHLGGQEVRCLEHGGGGFGFRCQMKWLPDLGYGVMVMTNSQDHDNVSENMVEGILQKIITLLTGKSDQGPSDWLTRHMPPRTVDHSYLPTGFEGRYNGTNDDMVFLVKEGRFGYASGSSFVPVTPISPYEYASRNYLYRFVCDATGRPTSVVRPYDGMAWMMGSNKNELRGPNRNEWQNYLGTYVRRRFGVSERFYVVSSRNGWLHFEGGGQDFLLTEHLPGLFFTPDGEAIDFRSSRSSFRNIKLYKVCD
jgi:CubicO group peptidase (beta-lactamase class C family)